MVDDRGGESQMYLTQSNVIRGLAKQDYTMLREMCQYSNNLYNVAVYTIRQHYFDTQQFLRYEENYPICKENENYGLLQAGVAQQILKVATAVFVLFSGFCRKSGQVTIGRKMSACRTIVKKGDGSISYCRRTLSTSRTAS